MRFSPTLPTQRSRPSTGSVPGEMVDGLGLAETTPGPTILVNQFVGHLAALRQPAPFAPLVAGILGALMTTWVTFLPSFVWIFAGAPYLDRLVGNPRLAGALAASPPPSWASSRPSR